MIGQFPSRDPFSVISYRVAVDYTLKYACSCICIQCICVLAVLGFKGGHKSGKSSSPKCNSYQIFNEFSTKS